MINQRGERLLDRICGETGHQESAHRLGTSLRARSSARAALRALLLVSACVLAAPAPAQSIYNDGGGTSGGARLDGGRPSGRFLDGGGTPRRVAPIRRYPRADDGFLIDGGGIRRDRDNEFGGSRRRFLEDGGRVSTGSGTLIERGAARQGFLDGSSGIRPDPNVLLGGSPDASLDGGGPVRARPRVRFADGPKFRPDRRERPGRYREGPGWRLLDAPDAVFASNGSFTIITRSGGNSVILSDVADFGRGTGSSPVAYAPDAAPVVSRGRASPGPKIIDVATDSLTSHPVRTGSIETLSLGRGGPKIIRIASDFGANAEPRDGSAAGVNPRGTDGRARPGEPWTREWLSACSRTHASFDPQFGTYRDRAGVVKFCTGE